MAKKNKSTKKEELEVKAEVTKEEVVEEPVVEEPVVEEKLEEPVVEEVVEEPVVVERPRKSVDELTKHELLQYNKTGILPFK